jgi:hypothetical protein
MYGCVPSQGRQFHLEEIIIRPAMAQPGEKINHLLFYYLCAPAPQETLQARVTRVVFSPAKEVVRDVTQYTFASGAWAIGVNFILPRDIPGGTYRIETIVSYQNQTDKRSTPFYVKRPSS